MSTNKARGAREEEEEEEEEGEEEEEEAYQAAAEEVYGCTRVTAAPLFVVFSDSKWQETHHASVEGHIQISLI